MGHHISAVVLKGPFDADRAATFDLKPIPLTTDLTLFPLNAGYIDHWAEKLGVPGFVSDTPLLNSAVVHHMLRAIASEPLFAVIETDYFGGKGSQSAAVYRGEAEVMTPTATAIGPLENSLGPINRALQLLGVTASPGLDEFATIGLDRHRDFWNLFEAYNE